MTIRKHWKRVAHSILSSKIWRRSAKKPCAPVCGNGGSAADAQHIAAEFVGRFHNERRSLPAIALTTDTSILTAVGNDYSFDRVFSRQVEGLGDPGDVLWGISTSGNSPDVLEALKIAREKGLTTIGSTGKTGGAMVLWCLFGGARRCHRPHSGDPHARGAYHLPDHR